MARDINGQIAGYRDLVESLAHKFVGRNDAEYDDLVQEGFISVWLALEKGVTPAAHLIEARMLDWVRLLGAQLGRGRGPSGEAVEYATLLPLDVPVGEYQEDGVPMLRRDVLTHDPVPLAGHDPLA